MISFDLFGKPIFPDVEPLRIPYMGSKNKIAHALFEKMLEIKPNAKYFFDLFGGGGSMSFFALQLGLKVHYNEKQKGLVDLIKYILIAKKGKYGLFPDDFYQFITREEFKILKDEDSLKGQFARICYSFGNGQRSYLFGDIERTKHLAHDIVMFQCEKALKEFNELNQVNYTISNAKTWNERRLHHKAEWNQHMKIKNCSKLEMLEQLQQLQRLEQLEQLQQLEGFTSFTISNLDFQEVKIETPPEETIIYLDPPYRGTAKYLEDALFEEIDNYFTNSPYDCFMSEYNAPFEPIFTIQKLSLMDNSQETKKIVNENLYYNKK